MHCYWCGGIIEEGQPKIYDDEWMHLGCSIEEGDSQIIDSEHG